MLIIKEDGSDFKRKRCQWRNYPHKADEFNLQSMGTLDCKFKIGKRMLQVYLHIARILKLLSAGYA